MNFNKHHFIIFSIILIIFIIVCFIFRNKKQITQPNKNISIFDKNNLLILKPMWGVGNRLRTIRKGYALCKYLGRELIIVERKDEGFDHDSMKELFGIEDIIFLTNQEFKLFQRDKEKKGLFQKVRRDENICNTNVNMDIVKKLNENKDNVLYFKSCGLHFDKQYDYIYKNYSFYNEVKSFLTKNTESIQSHFNINPNTKVVGIHIRQGSISDYIKGNFFGKWDNSDKTLKPFFPQFKDKSKNLSAYHPKAPPIEYFINIMNQYDTSVKFFICSDRTGVLLYLHQLYPDRILMNPLIIQNDLPNSLYGFKDFLMLSKCDEIIATGVGSFSTEAYKIRNIPIKRVWNVNIIT
tara:strand:- start:984 stop:2036 length:1053 start_codon:yes stop_codon:yes gene_type:complete